VSDSILYLAIVAIWAGFLIPAWLRRPHTAKDDLDAETAEYETDADAYAPTTEVVAETVSVDFEADVHLDAEGENSEYRYDVHMHSYRTAGSRPGGEPLARRPEAPRPSQSREQMMRARRRMLTILACLVFITAAFVLTGFVQWWICVPPLGMLVLYVLLLREIAMADAELAHKRATWEASAARDVWRRSHQAWEAEREAAAAAAVAAEPTAEIIDISSRVGDQLYDQYADAAVRAVGD
jgi:hypothetical protein